MSDKLAKIPAGASQQLLEQEQPEDVGDLESRNLDAGNELSKDSTPQPDLKLGEQENEAERTKSTVSGSEITPPQIDPASIPTNVPENIDVDQDLDVGDQVRKKSKQIEDSPGVQGSQDRNRKLMAEGHEENNKFKVDKNNKSTKNSLNEGNLSNSIPSVQAKVSSGNTSNPGDVPTLKNIGPETDEGIPLVSSESLCDLTLVKPQIQIRLVSDNESEIRVHINIKTVDPDPNIATISPAGDSSETDSAPETEDLRKGNSDIRKDVDPGLNVKKYSAIPARIPPVTDADLIEPYDSGSVDSEQGTVIPQPIVTQPSAPAFSGFSPGNFQNAAFDYSSYFIGGSKMKNRESVKWLFLILGFIVLIIIILYFLLRKAVKD